MGAGVGILEFIVEIKIVALLLSVFCKFVFVVLAKLIPF